MTKTEQEHKIYKAIMEKVSLDGWRSLAFNDLSGGFDLSALQSEKKLMNKTDILVAFSRFIDRETRKMADEELKDAQIPVKERLLEALMIRLDALKPYKKGVTKLLKAMPENPDVLLYGFKSLQCSMEATFDLIGFPRKGLTGIFQTRALYLIFLAGLCAWVRDESDDMVFTVRVLDKRLTQAEKLAANIGLTDMKTV